MGALGWEAGGAVGRVGVGTCFLNFPFFPAVKLTCWDGGVYLLRCGWELVGEDEGAARVRGLGVFCARIAVDWYSLDRWIISLVPDGLRLCNCYRRQKGVKLRVWNCHLFPTTTVFRWSEHKQSVRACGNFWTLRLVEGIRTRTTDVTVWESVSREYRPR